MSGTYSWVFLLLSILLNAAASLLLKAATKVTGSVQVLPVGSSIACYGLAFICYFICLRNLPVSIAYPVITGGAILIIVLSASLLGELITGAKLLGALLMAIGGLLLLRES